MNNRLKFFIETQHLSIRQFEDIIGSSDGKIAKFIAKNTNLKSDTLQKIMEFFPQLNIVWLLTGEEEMLKIANDSEEQTSNTLCKECALLKTKDELIETQRKLIQSLEIQMGIK
ncbi:MAG: hypothetical protein MJ009_00695 [Paludibacteraceae bacterium]|nr:hypothetical protein [Paludibacteraceae bacterium]